MKSDYHDPTITPQSNMDNLMATDDPVNAPFDTSLCDAVANGRVFILNGRGEMEQVRMLSYWYDNQIRNVFTEGYEINADDGEITRDWRPVTNRP